MIKRFLLPGLLFATVGLEAYELNKESLTKKGARYSLELSTGLREDRLKWNIGGSISANGQVYNPDILSELEWKKLRSHYSKVTLKGDEGRFALKLSFGYGSSFDGEVRDSDYFYSGRSGEFSRSISDSKGSEFYDYLAAIGYKYDIFENSMFIFFLGYEQNIQKLKIKNGVSEIPPSGAISGLDSRYETVWRNLFVGGDFQFRPTQNSELLLGYNYYWSSYEGKGYWNLRTDFSQNPSFKHTGNGGGYSLTLDYTYFFAQNWGANLKGEYKDMKIKNGDDITYFSNNTSSRTNLKEVDWSSYYLNLGLTYRF